MKKVFLAILMIFIFNIEVKAASGSLSVSSTTVYTGESFKVNVSISSAASWNIHVVPSGPVSGCSINQVDATADALDANKTFSATCTASGAGTITLMLSGDVTSVADGLAVNISDSKTITVLQKTAQPSGGNTTTVGEAKSSNNNLKEITVDGYELIKIDNNNYTLSVSSDVASINVNATPEDFKAKVIGTGVHELNVGENNIEIIITAPSGLQNKINVKVTKRDGYYIEDLDKALNSNSDEVSINLGTNNKIEKSDLEKVKDSKKKVNFNFYDETGTLKYSWIVDGSKLKDVEDLATGISYETENRKDILKLSNYADGVFINLKQEVVSSDGIKIRLYVGNKYGDDEAVNVYSYVKKEGKLELVESSLKVKNGYIEFETKNAKEYFVTMSNISNSNTMPLKNHNSVVLPLMIIIFVLVLAILLWFFLKRKKDKQNNNIKQINAR